MKYIWEHKDWPHFQYDVTSIQDILYQYALETGSLSGGLNQFSPQIQQETIIDFMVSEALKTSEIEGEHYQDEDVRSSILNQLGYATSPLAVKDPRALGIAQLMISVRKGFDEPLNENQLFSWHKMLFSQSPHSRFLEIGMWRTTSEPMQIISGPIGKEKVHFEAPPSDRVPYEMNRFMRWFNDTHPVTGKFKLQGPVRAAIAHLYFESIHPFSDGNGRIGRAIAEKALSQDLQRPVLLSLSTSIYKNKRSYYSQLSQASGNSIDITPWINYFVHIIHEAQLEAKNRVTFVFQKARFWNRYDSIINDRQRRVLQRLFLAGSDGFKGGINSQKYMKIADCSKASATRDLSDLLQKGCLILLPGGGRSTRYDLKLDEVE